MRQNFLRHGVLIAMLSFTSACFAAPPISPQVAIVTKLYQNFAFEAVLEEPAQANTSFIEQPRHILLRYITPKLADLLLRDRKCGETTHEICRLDFMPLWDSQDPIGAGVQVIPGSTAETVNVQLLYSPSSTPQLKHRLIYHLTHTVAGWRIRDISYGEGRMTLSEILESKLE